MVVSEVLVSFTWAVSFFEGHSPFHRYEYHAIPLRVPHDEISIHPLFRFVDNTLELDGAGAAVCGCSTAAAAA